jgi:hypothetical protein
LHDFLIHSKEILKQLHYMAQKTTIHQQAECQGGANNRGKAKKKYTENAGREHPGTQSTEEWQC